MIGGSHPKVTIVGGSIGGLCAGLALRGIGADVTVHEREPGPLYTRGAGIVVQPHLVSLLRDHHAPPLPTTACRVRRYLEPDGGKGRTQPMPQAFTSWEAIYVTLRAAFPDERYHLGTAITEVEDAPGRAVATIAGRGQVESDILIAADGANSALRRRFLPDVKPAYAGYVALRGTVDEGEATSRLVAFLDDAFTFCDARSGGHMLVYFIPGEGADARPGRRRLNWVWYIGAEGEDLDWFLTDRNGHRHHASLPQGTASEAMVRDLRLMARDELHPVFADLVEVTAEPFVQAIFDVTVPRSVFSRVMLVGDAAFVVRPHTAGAAAKAAHDASVLGRNLARARQNIDAGLSAAESLHLEYGRGLANYGIALGRQWAGFRPKRPVAS